MSLDQPPWPDAERIPEERIQDVFRPPPAIPATFVRSALVVGSRGAGKTILFRYLKETHKGFATHIYLSTEFASLTKAGYGPLAPKYPEDIEKKLSGKATALLAIAIADRLQRKGLSIPLDPLLRCLPRKFRQKPLNVDVQWVNDTRESVNKETLITFDEVAVGSPLVNFINTIEESNHRTHGPLLLLLDRADVVPPPALIPVFELLDQSGLFTTLVATRPGIGGESLSRTVRIVAPGDSYDVVHLGLYPRSSDWTDLVGQALEAQFGVQFLSLPQAIQDSIKVFARDSIKVAVELTSWCISFGGGCTSDDLVKLLEELRDSRLTAAQRTLQTYVDDFRDSIRTIHEQALNQHGSLTPGVLVTIKRRTQPVLFHEHTVLDIFVDAALRSWAVCMPEGQRWVPGLRPTQVEIPPLLIWTKNDRIWTTCGSLTQITISPSELTSRRGPRPRRPTIFIAYRMTFQESIRFRNNLEAYIHSYPGLNEAVVVDGNVPTGARWPETIRKRISKSHIAVGDVEGMRPDILFELGFAYGQGKVFIPTFKSHPARMEEIPDWLRGRQIGHYGEDSGLEKIVADIAVHLSDPEFIKPVSPPQPVPSLVVWLRTLDWNMHAMDQFKTHVGREGLSVEVFDDGKLTNERNIRRSASAGLLVMSLDGTEMDGLMHYIAGAVVSRPNAGRGEESLSRCVLVLEEKPRKFSALSLQKCEDSGDTVTVASPTEILDAANKFLRNYRRWVSRSQK